MATVCGFVEKIKYRNEDNGYTVLSLVAQGEEYILVGTFHFIAEGEMVEATGALTEHPIYGEQIQVESYEIKAPEDIYAMERYLASGAVKGIGPALAARIIRHFKADTFRIMEEEPERLSEVKGISEKMAMAISEQVEEKREMRQAMIYLQKYGISMNLAAKIFQQYGPRLYGIIEENPYQLADDIAGVGFKMADEIARHVGIFTDSDYRIKCGLLYTLLQAVNNGHTYLPEEELLAGAAELLGVEPQAMDKHLMDMQIEKKIVVKAEEEKRLVYGAQYYYMELNSAKMLMDLNIKGSQPEQEIRKRLKRIQKEEQISLDEQQIQAVIEAVNSGLLVITGGPGTGKTTIINTMIQYFEEEGMEILLAAPTGRAAKRMTEATGWEAKTVHRLLELTGGPEENHSAGMRFERNEENPLDADVIIIDEMSMVDIFLIHSLLKAVNVGTRLILVGDVNQLPSVGPGNVLKDIIDSGCFNVVKLTRIFRQASQSDIIVNAHKIHGGEQIPLGKRSNDFLFIKRDHPDAIISAMITLVKEKLPGYVNAQPYDIQIMTPMRKGALGVERLNEILQQYLNPPSPEKAEHEAGGCVFRVGDKVMQIKNNYQIEWEVRSRYGIPTEAGTGVFNGDVGLIREINKFAEQLTVEFDEGKMVDYSFKQLEELELAYAITIHKSQGSEYPAVVIPMYSGPRMLMTRNLIYTAVTRARACVCLVGLPDTFQSMVNNETEQRRYSGLKNRLRELKQYQEEQEDNSDFYEKAIL
ncbi:MAG: ATP-dependent RecD-like DNA helicase [Lachnoclostridium edouardi]|uniref:SF1B family DNA helicase RecD2 n=1 Tax=Lachnoclostridium edouardi TaxID=1926283 RepID=UPI0026DA8DC3|nr:ATP-dependent RecD-like DNA helicase [Lachnoclostridium edouardi]MDO4277392.1 ATP-dependent RecD-like DNA helicase [Lachnoclostridium edouardi]